MRLVGQNISDVKNRNLSVILRKVQHAGLISRTELAQETGLSNPAVGNLVNELLQMGLLKEVGMLNQPIGRSRVLLSLDEGSAQVIGIEMKRNGIFGLLANLNGVVRATSNKDFDAGSPSCQVLNALYEVIEKLMAVAALEKGRLLGIGIGTPGPIDVKQGMVFEPPNFPGLRNVALKRIVEERYGLPCILNDDARTSALGEAWFGAGRDIASLVFISIGEGIGSGIILDHRLYDGVHDIAGQIGHFTVEPRGKHCDCGNIGCFETVASIPAIAERARQAGYDVNGLSDTEMVSTLVTAYRAGDPNAGELFDETLDYVVAAVISAINAYDPEMVILGGRLIQLCPEMVDIVKRRVKARCFYHIANDLKITPSKLGPKTSALGAVTLLLQKLLSEPVAMLQMIEGREMEALS